MSGLGERSTNTESLSVVVPSETLAIYQAGCAGKTSMAESCEKKPCGFEVHW
jgi:hypothetical protein